ncbi:MAG TPA: restriction endonuclease subunit S [Anaerolineae bacterium]|nr:restriction endonuclease subunit S [Anaerolineae bacterium]
MDAEFFQPKFIRFDALMREGGQSLVDLFIDIIQPAEFIRKYVLQGEGAIFWRAQNIKRGYVDTENVEWIDWATFRRVPQSHVKEGDVLITRTGANAGDCAVTPPGTQNVAVSSHTLRLVPKDIELGFAVGAFFASDYGHEVLLRAVSGSSRPQITKDALETTMLPDFSSIKSEVARLIRAHYRKREQAIALYKQAESLLLAELGLDDLDLSHQLTYTLNFSQVWAAGRLDAEYFQPKYYTLLDRLWETGQAVRLGDWLREPISRGVQPEYNEDGTIIVINSQHVGKTCIELEDNRRTTREFAEQNERAVVRPHDVLLNSTGYITIGRCQTLLDDVPAIVDGHISIIRPKPGLDPVYLGLFLNSPAGQMQTERSWTGSSGQIELRKELIENYTVWKPDEALQQRIRNLIEDAHKARLEAKRLLEEAKQRVEAMILGE